MPLLNLVTKNTFLHLVDPDELSSSRSKSAPPKMIVASLAEEDRKFMQQKMLLRQQAGYPEQHSQRGNLLQPTAVERHSDYSKQGIMQNRGGQMLSEKQQNFVAEGAPKDKYKRTDLVKKYGGDSMDKAEITSLMIRHIPCRCTSDDITAEIEAAGFGGLYDFFYMPCDRRQPSKHNLGYAFINFVSPEAATGFQRVFAGYRFGGEASRSAKECAISAAAVQGLKNNWSHFRRTAVFRTDRCPAFIRTNGEAGATKMKR